MSGQSSGRGWVWILTGAAVVLTSALFGAPPARRKKTEVEDPEDQDLADRPVARAVLEESLAAAQRVKELSEALAALEKRMEARFEALTAPDADSLSARVQRLEERLKQILAGRNADVISEVESRLASRLAGLESLIDEHQAAIRQLQTHAAQTEINIQKMILAVEKLADQVSRNLGAASARGESRRAGEAPPETSAGTASPSETPPADTSEKTVPIRWKSAASA